MSHERARQSVLTTLAKKQIQKINFRVGSVSITPRLMGRVRTCIVQRRIGVKHNPRLSSAEYDGGTNELYLPWDHVQRMTQEALIVHECVHAGLDLANASQMRLTSSEAAGYIAQCIYARLHTTDPNTRLMSTRPGGDAVFEVGWEIAGEVIAGRQPTTAALNRMRAAVSRHPNYRNGRHLAGYNGVP